MQSNYCSGARRGDTDDRGSTAALNTSLRGALALLGGAPVPERGMSQVFVYGTLQANEVLQVGGMPRQHPTSEPPPQLSHHTPYRRGIDLPGAESHLECQTGLLPLSRLRTDGAYALRCGVAGAAQELLATKTMGFSMVVQTL